MWLKRWLALTIIVFLQLLIIADALNRLAEDPEADVWWVGAFGVTLAYLFVGGVLLIISYIKLVMLYSARRTNELQQSQQQQNAEQIEQALEEKRETNVLLGDSIVDTLLYVPLVVFIALLIDQFEHADDDGQLHNWIGVFIWFVIFGLLLSAVLLISAIRTCGEERLQRGELPTKLCCSAAFTDVIEGFSLDHDELELARSKRRDKVDSYVADSEFHSIPCSTLCTYKLTANIFDFLLNWLLYLIAPLATLSALLLGVRLETGSPSLNWVLGPVFVLGIAITVGALFSFVLICCDNRARGYGAPPRFSFTYVIHKTTISFFLALAFVVFLLLLLDQIGRTGDDIVDWNLIFLPLYIVLVASMLIGCCYFAAAKSTNTTRHADDGAPTAPRQTTNSKTRVKVIQRDLQRQQQSTARNTSGYGLFV